ncbi:MAG: hypothetical protein CMI55_04125 [Parcubacteria group bacterium]|jgi:type IV pilus assembly protein PilM|nr:hypothetical protein [Parcubacteria group bacterium]|tara:strand:+ start:949 stop:2013 length:1065 start_codon:yes stop_codon:yes gene_type:complete
MSLFKKKSNSLLGIDIGASAIKLVQLEKENGRHKLKNYGIFPLAEYLKSRNYQAYLELLKVPAKEVAGIVKKVIKEAKIKSREACVSIPVYSSFFTLIDLPNMSEKEVAATVPFEARKYVPVPISEVILDWSIVGKSDKGSSQQILIIAVPKEIINRYKQIIKLAGLNLWRMEAETFSLARALVGNDKSAITLVDAGARSVNISIVDGGFIKATHNLETGGLKIIKMISQRMKLYPQESEKLKHTLLTTGLAEIENTEIKDMLYSILNTIITEIKKITDSYQNKRNRKIERYILVGGVSQTLGLVDYFTDKLGVEVSLGDPFARVAYPSLLKSVVKELGPCLAAAVGLGMGEIQ